MKIAPIIVASLVAGAAISTAAMAEIEVNVPTPAPVYYIVAEHTGGYRTTASDVIYHRTTPPAVNITILPKDEDIAISPNPETDEPAWETTDMTPSKEKLLGDIDEDHRLTAKDAAFLLKALDAGDLLDPEVADFNKDGEVTALDAQCILEYIVTNNI